jgi:hypothetical protein
MSLRGKAWEEDNEVAMDWGFSTAAWRKNLQAGGERAELRSRAM